MIQIANSAHVPVTSPPSDRCTPVLWSDGGSLPPIDDPGDGDPHPNGPRQPSAGALVLLGLVGIAIVIAYHWINPATTVIVLGTMACFGLWHLSRKRQTEPNRSAMTARPACSLRQGRTIQLLTPDEQSLWLRGAVAVSLAQLFEQTATADQSSRHTTTIAEPTSDSASAAWRRHVSPVPEVLVCTDLTKIYLA